LKPLAGLAVSVIMGKRGSFMPFGIKFFCFLFVMIALGDLAHDYYIWSLDQQTQVFSIVPMGWSFKHYLPEEHQMLIDTLSPETFNMLLTPILALPAAFLFAGLTVFLVAAYFLVKMVSLARGGGVKDTSYDYKRR